MEAKTPVDTLADRLAKAEAQTIGNTLVDGEIEELVDILTNKLTEVEAESLVDTPADTLAEVKADTLGATLGDVEDEAILDKLRERLAEVEVAILRDTLAETLAEAEAQTLSDTLLDNILTLCQIGQCTTPKEMCECVHIFTWNTITIHCSD